MSLLLLAILGCSDPEPPPEPTRAWAPPAEPEARVALAQHPDGRPVVLRTNGLGPLYQRYFSEPEAATALSLGMASCSDGPVEVAVTYDSDSRTGRVALVMPAARLTCAATPRGEGLDVSALSGLAAPLAEWRNALGATRDMRIYGFATALHLEDGFGAATLWLEGQDPLDGSAFGPCLGIDGLEHCPHPPEARREGVTTYAVEGRPGRRLANLLAPDR